MKSNIHSSNTELEINTESETSYTDSLFYFERNNEGIINGFFEVDASKAFMFDEIMLKKEDMYMNLLWPNDEIIESIEELYIYKQEFVRPEYGSVVCRYYFSTKLNSDWKASIELINSMRYNDRKTFDYAVADRVKELTDEVKKISYPITINSTNDKYPINTNSSIEVDKIVKQIESDFSKKLAYQRC
jgi:hypothetical protein